MCDYIHIEDQNISPPTEITLLNKYFLNDLRKDCHFHAQHLHTLNVNEREKCSYLQSISKRKSIYVKVNSLKSH